MICIGFFDCKSAGKDIMLKSGLHRVDMAVIIRFMKINVFRKGMSVTLTEDL